MGNDDEKQNMEDEEDEDEEEEDWVDVDVRFREGLVALEVLFKVRNILLFYALSFFFPLCVSV